MKKLNQKGITHHLLLIGLAVLAVGAISLAGYRVWNNKNDVKAKAAGWSNSPIGLNGVAFVCKINNGTKKSVNVVIANTTSQSRVYTVTTSFYGFMATVPAKQYSRIMNAGEYLFGDSSGISVRSGDFGANFVFSNLQTC